MRQNIFTWKTPTNYEGKKLRGLRPTNLNLLFEIKLHRFTWLFYLKDLLFNTYNSIHVHNTTTLYCSLVSFGHSERIKNFFNQRFKDQIFEREIRNCVAN